MGLARNGAFALALCLFVPCKALGILLRLATVDQCASFVLRAPPKSLIANQLRFSRLTLPS